MPIDSNTLDTNPYTHARIYYDSKDDTRWIRPACIPGQCNLVPVYRSGKSHASKHTTWVVTHDPVIHEMHGSLQEPQDKPQKPLRYRDLRIDVSSWLASIGGKRLPLSTTESKILMVLAQAPNTTVLYTRLIKVMWNNQYSISNNPQDMHYLRVVISRLRKKLGVYGNIIDTVPRIGIRLSLDLDE